MRSWAWIVASIICIILAANVSATAQRQIGPGTLVKETTACLDDRPATDTTLTARLAGRAFAFRCYDTSWSLTNCRTPFPPVPGQRADWLGNCACAASVKHVFHAVTPAIPGDFADRWYSVDAWYSLALGQPVNGVRATGSIVANCRNNCATTVRGARPGDVVIWMAWVPTYTDREGRLIPGHFDDVHIGFCATDGCAHTWSNASTRTADCNYRCTEFAPYAVASIKSEYPFYTIWDPQTVVARQMAPAPNPYAQQFARATTNRLRISNERPSFVLPGVFSAMIDRSLYPGVRHHPGYTEQAITIAGDYALLSVSLPESSITVVLMHESNGWVELGATGGAVMPDNLTRRGVPLTVADSLLGSAPGGRAYSLGVAEAAR